MLSPVVRASEIQQSIVQAPQRRYGPGIVAEISSANHGRTKTPRIAAPISSIRLSSVLISLISPFSSVLS